MKFQPELKKPASWYSLARLARAAEPCQLVGVDHHPVVGDSQNRRYGQPEPADLAFVQLPQPIRDRLRPGLAAGQATQLERGRSDIPNVEFSRSSAGGSAGPPWASQADP